MFVTLRNPSNENEYLKNQNLRKEESSSPNSNYGTKENQPKSLCKKELSFLT